MKENKFMKNDLCVKLIHLTSYQLQQQLSEKNLQREGTSWDPQLGPQEEWGLLKYFASQGAQLLGTESTMTHPNTKNSTVLRAQGILGPLPYGNSWYLGSMKFYCQPNTSENSVELENYAKILWETLLDQANQIVACEGSERLIAPLAYSSWFPYRLRTDDQEASYPWEPLRIQGLKEAFKTTGFENLERYRSVGSEGLAEFAMRMKEPYDAAIAKGFTFRRLESFSDPKRVVHRLWEICQLAFQKSPYFLPISFQDFADFYLPKIDSKKTLEMEQNSAHVVQNTVCVSPTGEIAGFILGYRSQTELVFKSMAIDKLFQGMKLGDAVLYPMAAEAVQSGIDHFVSALVLEGNKSEFVFRKNKTRWEHTYSIFGKKIGN